MMTRHRLAEWTAFGAIVLWQGLGIDMPQARAQGAPAPAAAGNAAAPIRRVTNQTRFRLPVQIDDQERAQLKAIRLFVRRVPDDWQQIETAAPTQKFFLPEVHQDGEYWFSVVAIDNSDRANPADVRREPPQLIVVVDTQPPVVDVQPSTGPNGESWLRCTVTDANPDFASLKLSYRGADQNWHGLEPLPGMRGVFSAPAAEAQASTFRVSMADLAKNVMTRDVTLKDTAAAVPSPGSASKAPGPLTLENNPAVPLPPARTNNQEAAANPAPGGPALPPPVENVVVQPPPTGNIERTSYSPAPSPRPVAASRQLLNTTRASLDYRLDQVGASGVSKVEVYITSDEGRTWKRLGEDPDRRSPAEINLPGEGLFGVRLVVTNGNGFGGTPPAPGDTPTCWIEVDMTGPHVQLRDIDPVVKDGALEIRWIATDKNLSAEPVSLSYATHKGGPWTPIVRGLRNEGVYRWAFPREAGAQFLLRLEVVDQAGNVSRCESASPVQLDMTEPRALVLGVSGVTARTGTVGGGQ